MTPRSLRRAAERKAVKQARKADQTAAHTAPSPSPAQIAANQANSQLSTGPRTDQGKQISSQNALRTALTGRTVLLPLDDLAAYEIVLNASLDDFNPANAQERELVQSMVDCGWRLQRILNLEFGIYAKGSLEFADEFPDLEPAAKAQMIQVETYLKYEKSLRNLSTQEARLQRRLVKDTAELKRLQAERQQLEAETQAFLAARHQRSSTSSAPARIGFEFSDASAVGSSAVASTLVHDPGVADSALLPAEIITADNAAR